MSDLNINNITDRTGDSGPVIAGVSTVSSTGAFTVPVGPTEYRGGRGRAVFGGGYGASSPYPELNVLDMVNITTTGNASDFGDLTIGRTANGMGGNATRGIFAGGRYPGPNNDQTQIDYVTFSSSGGANDFGDLSNRPQSSGAFSDSTRGIFSGGYDSRTSPYPGLRQQTFITIASTGNSSDFGDAVDPGRKDYGFSNATRGFTCGSSTQGASPSNLDEIEMTTIQTKGSCVIFGELDGQGGAAHSLIGSLQCWGGAASQTRGIIFSGQSSPASSRNVIEYLTLSTFGNSQDFGDMLTSGSSSGATSTGNQIRAVVKTTSANDGNVLEQVTIATTGNATDFGDLNTGRRVYGSVCDSHGGLG